MAAVATAPAAEAAPRRRRLPRPGLTIPRPPRGVDWGRVLCIALIALAAVALAWSWLTVLSQSLWSDEAYSVVHYILPGPSAIWSAPDWVPNNQPLFELLGWATTGILGSHVEAVVRLWSVLPAMAAVATLTGWLWIRFDRFSAAAFAVLAAVAPIAYDLGPQARGYGLGFLAAALVIVAADGVARTGGNGWLWVLSAAGFAGIATLQNFTAFYVAAALVVIAKGRRRRGVIVSVIVVGVLSLAWYAPLLSTIIGYKNLAVRTKLGLSGIVIAPVRDLFGAGIHTLLPGVSVTAGSIVSAVVLGLGVIVLVRIPERTVVLLLTMPVLASYALIAVAATYTPRFASFALMPLAVLAAIALARVAVGVAGRPVAGVLGPALLAVCAVLALGRFSSYAAGYGQEPYEQARYAAQLVLGQTGQDAPQLILSNHPLTAFEYYFGPRRPHSPLKLSSLEHEFCHYKGRMAYVEQGGYPSPDLSCLTSRGAFRIAIPQHRSPLSVWLISALK